MNCTKAREQLRETAAAGLTPEGAVAAHVESCADCHGYAVSLAGMFDTLGIPTFERSSASWTRFNNAVHAALGERTERTRRIHQIEWRVFPAALAACALLIALVVVPPQFVDRGSDNMSEYQLVEAVYSGRNAFSEQSAILHPTSDRDPQQQEWTARHLMRSGSSMDYRLTSDIADIAPEEEQAVFDNLIHNRLKQE
jgi:hypothetical protein